MPATNIDLTKIPIDVTDHIHKFVKLLNTFWPRMDELTEYHDWDEDELFHHDVKQALWLLLVERELLGDKGRIMGLTEDKRTFSKEDYWTNTYAIVAKWDQPIVNCRTLEPISPEGTWRVVDFCHLKCEDNNRTIIRWLTPFDALWMIRMFPCSQTYVYLKDLRFYLDKAPIPPFYQ
ncbi:MAG: hypothetical protein WB791_00155 [Waddliaceae bacterium]